ncbi:hypothetical protein GCM10011490_13250 [Pseudoclavibacter endophyticus]|uniref:Serine hydrolase n=1 Tax=Pseudoclavibacter endophyticus TaxID=1778590 RepID=A0A6H9WED1_9MICO|nr:serine hydrolase [Pseudoclavibacter endophyticus]KAB1649272.1 serine hydrolase [Pseudoclavibacter endophyticus]GGA63962.1 hypothetical protein GCM10011490_13250 [Pseudoclavibacter endophyticus]
MGTFTDLHLFTGAPQLENFGRIVELMPTRTMAPSSAPLEWPVGEPTDLPETYDFLGEQRSTRRYLVDADVAGLLVLKNGEIRHEWYGPTSGPDVPWLSMSVAKSFVSLLVGIAVEAGHIASIDDAISEYIAVEPGTAYDGVAIQSVLQMSSGARWNEDYSDPEADPLRTAQAVAGTPGGLDRLVATLPRDLPADTLCRYNSCDTQALAALVRAATGQTLADYLQAKVCEPLGFTSPGAWIIDAEGVDAGFAGLNLVARDYARIGELYRNGGVFDGTRVVSADWVRASTRANEPHTQPGEVTVGGTRLPVGYGYQWWVHPGGRGDFSAIGVYNQYVYVDPGTQTTIVMNSATRLFGSSPDPSVNMDIDVTSLFRAIADHVA